jgi:hypothetical protein
MAQYIELDAVVTEIERRIADNKREIERASHKSLEDYFEGYEDALVLFKEKFLDTLEVKEVDLHKELDDYIERQKAWIKDDWVVEYNNGDSFNHIYDLEKISKHFFELGLKVEDWKKKRMEECPYRQVGCTMYEGKILECRGACSWVVDYPKLKELKAQKGK